jgi:hypothetical protein
MVLWRGTALLCGCIGKMEGFSDQIIEKGLKGIKFIPEFEAPR